MSRSLLFVPLVLATGLVLAGEPESTTPPEAQARKEPAKKDEAKKDEAKKEEAKKEEAKELSGMSILGNQEAPKALVIVPWKSSELGHSIGIVPLLDDSRQPIDKEVFMRALGYYEIRSETTRPGGAPAGGVGAAAAGSNASQDAIPARRRKP